MSPLGPGPFRERALAPPAQGRSPGGFPALLRFCGLNEPVAGRRIDPLIPKMGVDAVTDIQGKNCL